MHTAWLYLLHAEFERGEWTTSTEQARPRQNIEFFIGLRNKVEHHCQDVLLVATAGMAHAYVINYETEMVARFGASTRSPESSASRSSCTP
jgi:hypothetical protein